MGHSIVPAALLAITAHRILAPQEKYMGIALFFPAHHQKIDQQQLIDGLWHIQSALKNHEHRQ